MKILFLSQRFILPMDTGGKIRTGKILEQLSKSDEVTVISNVESPKDDPYLPQIVSFCSRFVQVPWKELPRYSVKFFLRLAFQALSVYPVTELNTYSKTLHKAVDTAHAQGDYDVAVCDFVQCGRMFDNIKGSIPTVLFQHNVESEIARRHIDQASNVLARLFWWLQWKKMCAYEAKHCRSLDTVIAVSEHDSQTFQELYGATNTAVIPTGVDIDYFSPSDEADIEPGSLVFCGSMDWLPNEDGVIYFIEQVLPRIADRIPHSKLTVVGRKPSPALLKVTANRPEIVLTGWVDDTRPHISRSAVFIVPLRIGGGTRMKIFEAMAMGKAVVSTSIGAEGLPVSNGDNICIEDDPDLFADKVIELLTDEALRARLGTSACEYVRANFGWQRVAAEFRAICASTMDEHTTSRTATTID